MAKAQNSWNVQLLALFTLKTLILDFHSLPNVIVHSQILGKPWVVQSGGNHQELWPLSGWNGIPDKMEVVNRRANHKSGRLVIENDDIRSG